MIEFSGNQRNRRGQREREREREMIPSYSNQGNCALSLEGKRERNQNRGLAAGPVSELVLCCVAVVVLNSRRVKVYELLRVVVETSTYTYPYTYMYVYV